MPNEQATLVEYIDSLKQTIEVECIARRAQMEDEDGVRSLEQTRIRFQASLNAFRLIKTTVKKAPQVKKKEEYFKPNSVLYIESRYIPNELRLRQANRCDLGVLVFVADHELDRAGLEVVTHMLYLNLCNNYDYSMVGRGVEFFFDVDRDRLAEELDKIRGKAYLDDRNEVKLLR
jgi:hypothetical protein